MPVLHPLPADHDPRFRTSGLFTLAGRAALEFAAAAASMPGAVTPTIGTGLRRDAPAVEDGRRWLAARGCSAGKHVAAPGGAA